MSTVNRPKNFEQLGWDEQCRWMYHAAEELAAKAELHLTEHWAVGSNLKCYLVTLDLHTIGKVEQTRVTPYRKIGRLRRDFKQRIEWDACLSPQQVGRVIGLYYRTRKAAVRELCEDWLRHRGDLLHAPRTDSRVMHPLACGGTGRIADLAAGEGVSCPDCLHLKVNP